MSSVILNSAANSALINTLNASASLSNPNIYATAPIYPAHSVTYAQNQPSNGNQPVKGNSTVFQLNKYGIISQILLTYKKTYTNASGGALTGVGSVQNDFFNILEKVELLSSSRVVSTLTKVDLMAQFSNLPTNKLVVIAENLLNPQLVGSGATAGNLASGATSNELSFTAPLVFGFMKDINTQLNASFLEPLSIRCTWGNTWDQATGRAAGLTGNVFSPQLSVRYKNYPEDQNAAIISQNFSNPSLNILSTKFTDENRGTYISTTNQAETDASIEVELKNTECVNNFYVVLLESNPNALGGASSTGASGELNPAPELIKTVEFTGSGQEIVSLKSHEMAYGRLDTDGFSVGQSIADNANHLSRVAKFQTGVYGDGVLSNTISLREINAPRIKVTFDIEARTELVRYYLYVVEDCSAIYSVTSATGALQVSLAN